MEISAPKSCISSHFCSDTLTTYDGGLARIVKCAVNLKMKLGPIFEVAIKVTLRVVIGIQFNIGILEKSENNHS